MSRTTLFQQLIENDQDVVNNTFIKLEVDASSDIFLTDSKLLGLTVKEVTGTSTFIVSMTITDLFGDLVNHAIVEGSFDFWLTIGRDEFDNVQYKMKPAKINTANIASAASKNYAYTITFVSHSWKEMFLTRHNRAWSDKKYSDIVKEIADEIGFNEVHITETDKLTPLTIQPYWTNFEMLRWIKKRSSSTSGAGFDFALTSNDGFFFSSYGDLITRRTLGIQDTKEQQPILTLTMKRLTEDNYDDGFRSIDRIELGQDYMIAMKSGASGVSSSHYDYMNKQYTGKREQTFSQSEIPQLSEKAFISESDELVGANIYTFTDTESDEMARQKLSFISNKIQTLRVHTPGVSEVHVGNVVEVQIPLGVDESQLPYNELLSGFYLVTGKETSVGQSGTATTILRLTRHGVNTQDTKTLVESRRGRI